MKLIRVCDPDEEYSENFTENKSSMTKILIKMVTQKDFTLFKLKSSDTICQLKTMIKSKTGVPLDRQTLVYNGKVLEDDQETLASCNVISWSVVHAIFCPPEIVNPKVDGVDVSVRVGRCCKPSKGSFKAFMVEVKPWYTGREIKVLAESATGFNGFEDYVISHGGKLIGDSMSMISKCSVNKNLPINLFLLENNKFQVIARGCGWEELILVTESHTVLDVKEKVERFAQVQAKKLGLFCGDHNNMLYLDDDEKTLGFYNLKGMKSTIWVLGCSSKLSIKMPQVGDMIMVSDYRVNFIKDIKHYICENMGIPCSNQKLFYRGLLLDVSKSLEDYEMEGNCVLYATFGSSDGQVEESDEEISFTPQEEVQEESGLIEIKLQCSNFQESESITAESESENELTEIKLKSSDTIFDLKAVVESLTDGVPIYVQQLYCGDKMLKDWEDWNTIRDYNITKLCFISSPLTIFVSTDITSDNNDSYLQIVLEVKSLDIIDDILDMLPQALVESINGQPCLFFDGTALEGTKALAQYGIQSGSLLSLDRLVQVNVTRPNGRVTKVDVNPSFRIKVVKEKIEETCGIPYGLQTLAYGGDELDDQMTIGEYEAILGSLWVLRWKFGRSSWSFFWPSYKDCTTD